MEYFYNLSAASKVLLFVILCCSAAIFIYYSLNFGIRRKLPDESYFEVEFLGTLGSLCSMLLIFVLIQAISINANINATVSQQLSEMYKFEKHLMTMPKNYVAEIKPHFAAYLDSIISEEWRLMGLEEKGNNTENTFDEFLMSVAKVQDMDSGVKHLTSDLSPTTDALIKTRYLKLRTKASALPLELYAGIAFLLLLNVFQFFLLANRSMHSLISLLVHVTAQGLILGLIFVYDHPFYGDRGVKAEAYQDVRLKLEPIEGR